MAFVPHTREDRELMMQAVGVGDIKELFTDIPEARRFPDLELPPPLSEPEVLAELAQMAGRNWNLDQHVCFLGAGRTTTSFPVWSSTC